MGKHKHRRRDREDGYVQEQVNGGYNGGYNNDQMNGNMQMNNANMGNNGGQMGMNNTMGMNNPMGMGGSPMGMGGSPMGMGGNPMGMGGNPMNIMNMLGGSNPLASILGSLGGNSNGILDLINSLGLTGGSESGGGDIMGMISSLLGGGNTQPASNNFNTKEGNNSIEELLSNMRPEDFDQIKNMLGNINLKKDSGSNVKESRNEKTTNGSVDEILANLDFNAILNNMNNMDLSNMDISNMDLNNLDINDIMNNNEFVEDNITTVDEDDIIEENIFREGRDLSKEEYGKLINILIKLIDPNKIKLLQRVLKEYSKV